jgi:uncharacterized membrane protein
MLLRIWRFFKNIWVVGVVPTPVHIFASFVVFQVSIGTKGTQVDVANVAKLA